MKTNIVKLESLIEDFAAETGGGCCEVSAFVGEIDGKIVRLSVMTKEEALNQHDFEEINEHHRCIES